MNLLLIAEALISLLLVLGSLFAFTGSLGMLLFIVTLLLNMVALKIVRKYREQYE